MSIVKPPWISIFINTDEHMEKYRKTPITTIWGSQPTVRDSDHQSPKLCLDTGRLTEWRMNAHRSNIAGRTASEVIPCKVCYFLTIFIKNFMIVINNFLFIMYCKLECIIWTHWVIWLEPIMCSASISQCCVLYLWLFVDFLQKSPSVSLKVETSSWL